MLSDAKKKTADSRPAIEISNVSKEFVIPHERRTTLFENVIGAFKPATYEKFVALKDINLVIEKGESVGIIGDNGSGKSTLLKIIAKILRPTSGSVKINGRITPFLELGVGFQPDLTARENIEVYSTIMGLSNKEIAANMDSVLKFAGLTKFKDTKLKNFSSGMYVRLAFATAIQVKPEILIVDEVLAVGDMDFQQKCLDVFQKYKQEGITLIFVSHDLNSVRKFCDKTLLLKNSQMVAYGNTGDVIDTYIYGRHEDNTEAEPVPVSPVQNNVVESPVHPEVVEAEKPRWGNKKVEITKVTFIDKYGKTNTTFASGDPMLMRIHYTVNEGCKGLHFGIAIYNDANLHCYGTATRFRNFFASTKAGENRVDLKIRRVPMLEGRYYVTFAAVSEARETYDYHNRLYSFTVQKDTQDIGLINIDCVWENPGDNLQG